MKHRLLSAFTAALVVLIGTGITTPSLHAQERTYYGQEVEVLGTRPGAKTPVTQERLKVEELSRRNIAWDIPTLLLGTPSLFVMSDGGLMGGYTSFSIRGVDASRVNITNMGIPLNDSESQVVFWANMPDYGSRLEDLVIVRGAGGSAFGAGAFGATMDMRSRRPSLTAGGRVASFFGSYGLSRHYLSVESGALGRGWALNAHVSRIGSDGYVERSGGKGLSYMIHATRRGESSSLDIVHNRGLQQTGIAWNGLEDGQRKLYSRRYNSAGHMNPDESAQAPHLAAYLPNTDNYDQAHTYLIYKKVLSEAWKYSATLHHTHGYGYTHEYRTGRRMREYGLAPMDVKTKTDLIRNKYLNNHFYGAVASLEYTSSALRATVGAAANRYTNDHYGTIDFVKGTPLLPFQPGQEYYRNHSVRNDVSLYAKAEYDLTRTTLLYADVMYRHLRHTMKGPTDKYDKIKKQMDLLDYDLRYNFMLPKAGITQQLGRNLSLYASVATAAKEPNRKAYTESKHYVNGVHQMPRPEHMIDYELGLNARYRNLSLHLNGYYMDYTDQLVTNGSISDVGEPILINVPQSYRAGVEASLTWEIHPTLFVHTNLALSRNKIKDFDLVERDADDENEMITRLKETTIAQSPSVVFNHIIGWSPWRPVQLLLTGNYVGKRYLDNSNEASRSIPSYYTANLKLNYTHALHRNSRVTYSLQINNLFNKEYVTSGWASGYYEKSGANIERKAWTGYYPAAPTHIVAGVTIDF